MLLESVQAYTRRIRPHLPFLLLTVCIVVISYPAWIHAGMPGTDDLLNLNIPQRQFLGASYKQGQWPLWNPFSFGGQPFLAAGQSGPLYLPNLVYIIFPIVAAVKVSYILHELLLACGSYLAAWHFSKSRLGAFTGAVTFADCGFFVGHQIHTQMFDATCWLPLCVFLFARLFERPGRRLWILCTFSLGAEVYAGHPQITFYLCLFLVLYLLLMFAWHPSRRQGRSLLWSMLSIAGGFAVSAAQWLPTLQLVVYSDRSAVPASFLLAASMPPVGLASLLMPFLAGGGYTGRAVTMGNYIHQFGWYTFWEFTCYAGIISLLLACAAVLTCTLRNLYVRTLAVIGGLALVLSLGLNTSASLLLVHAPGFDLFRVPARYISLVDFCIAMLTAIAISTLQTAERQGRFKTTLMLAAAGAVPGILTIRVFSAAATAPRMAYIVPWMLAVIVMLICVWDAAVLRRRLPVIMAVLAVIDVSYAALSTSTYVDWQQGSYAKPPSIDKWLSVHAGKEGWPRIVSFGNTSVQLDRNVSFGIPSIDGWDSVVPSWYANDIGLAQSDSLFLDEPRSLADALGVRYAVTAKGMTLPFPTTTNGFQTWQTTVPDLNAADISLRVNLNLSRSQFASQGAIFSVTLRSGGRTLTRLVSGWPASGYLIPIPRNWPHYRPTVVRITNEAWNGWYRIQNLQVNQDGTLKTISVRRTFAPKGWKRVYYDGHETVWRNPDILSRAWFANNKGAPLVQTVGRAIYTGGTHNRQTWSVQTGHAAYFVLSQMYDPNWTAVIDGKRTSVVRVDGVLPAIHVPAGSHTVTLDYDPFSFRLGLALSILTSLGLFGLLLPSEAQFNRRFRATRRA